MTHDAHDPPRAQPGHDAGRAQRATAIVADDEPLLRQGLRAALADAWPELDVVAEAANGREAVDVVNAHRPQFAFLDIEMPQLNGLEAARVVRDRVHVVFVTAYDRYAVDAFERGAIDYVLKPAAPARLAETVRRLKSRVAQASLPPAMDALIDELSKRLATSTQRLQWLQASLGSTLRLISVEDVLYFRAETKYTRVVTREGEALVRKTLRELADVLDPQHFWQVHRSVIVNIRAIASVTSEGDGTREIALTGRPEKLEVSRTYAHLFRPS